MAVFDAFGALVGGTSGFAALCLTVCGLGKRWLRYRENTQQEAEHTRRVALAVQGTDSRDRAAVVRACAQRRS